MTPDPPYDELIRRVGRGDEEAAASAQRAAAYLEDNLRDSRTTTNDSVDLVLALSAVYLDRMELNGNQTDVVTQGTNR